MDEEMDSVDGVYSFNRIYDLWHTRYRHFSRTRPGKTPIVSFSNRSRGLVHRLIDRN